MKLNLKVHNNFRDLFNQFTISDFFRNANARLTYRKYVKQWRKVAERVILQSTFTGAVLWALGTRHWARMRRGLVVASPGI